jgi:hypothetical protein
LCVVVLCIVQLHADDTKTAQAMLNFMLAWYERFPQFKSNKLFLAGQSYAGALCVYMYDGYLLTAGLVVISIALTPDLTNWGVRHATEYALWAPS